MKALKRIQICCSNCVLSVAATTHVRYSTTQSEIRSNLVLVSKDKSPSGGWPENKLGPIDAINPKFPLPGYVGVLEQKRLAKITVTPAVVNLPAPSSDHYSAIMDQAHQVADDVSLGITPLMPTIDRSILNFSIYSCPRIFHSDLRSLFPDRDVSRIGMTVVIMTPPAVSLMHLKMIEKEMLVTAFIETSLDICKSLKDMGYWADFIDPCTKKPYLGAHLNETMTEIFVPFSISIDDLGRCKFSRNISEAVDNFTGFLFTDAPKDHPLLSHLPF